MYGTDFTTEEVRPLTANSLVGSAIAGTPIVITKRGSVEVTVSWMETLMKVDSDVVMSCSHSRSTLPQGTKAGRVVDKELQNAIIRTARRNVWTSFLLAVACVAAAVAVPPQNIIHGSYLPFTDSYSVERSDQERPISVKAVVYSKNQLVMDSALLYHFE